MINATTPENLPVRWSAPEEKPTARGQRVIRTAEPTPEFWGMWRRDSESIRKMGVNPRMVSGAWLVFWYAEVSAITTPSVPVVVPPVTTVSIVPSTNGVRWSDEQEAIFRWFNNSSLASGVKSKALIVRARAGTGKTTTIKTAFTVAPEERMLYAVFNKKNQREAAAAISDPRVDIKTLHSVGFSYIQQVWPNSKPTDEVEKDRIDSVLGEVPTEIKTQVKKLVGFAKNMTVNPTLDELISLAESRDIECPGFEAEENGGWNTRRLAEAALKVLELSCVRDAQNRISYNDMVWLPVRKNWVQALYDLVVVDEAQDMSLPQLTMAKAAVRKNGRICVVGDDRQAIYGFRGAATDGMDMMKRTLNAQELGLTITYRCPKSVVALAATIVPDYRAADTAPEGIVDGLSKVNDMFLTDVKIGDVILSRSNAPLMPYCLALLKRGVSARIEGRDIGKALIAIVKKVNARTVPQFITKLETWGEKQKNRFSGSKHFEEKCIEINDQVDTLTAVADGASSVAEIETRLKNLFQDSEDNKTPSVILSTAHKAKGLEFPRVFLLTETFRRAVKNSPKSEAEIARSVQEEANVYYVALTRAKHHLTLVS